MKSQTTKKLKPVKHIPEFTIISDKNDKKYWIVKGKAVFQIDNPDLKMRVDEIKKIVKEINDGKGGKLSKTFIIGVDVHWIDKDDKFQKARFSTRELLEWDDDKEIRTKKISCMR
jgi:uncharacterized pyridoxamine 5'-phosphate oxidase family protein